MKTKKPRYAAKILALVLSMLMLLGAMPVAFAAEPAPVTEWPTFEKAELMYQEPYSNLILVGGKAEIPGTFTFAYPTKFPNRLGDGLKVPLSFIPEDTTNYTKKNGAAGATITVVQSTAARIEGTLSATMLKDQKLSEAEFVKSADFAMMNFNTRHNCTITWENPDKAMDKAGSFEEKVVIASSDKGEEFVKPIEMVIIVKVIGSVDEIPELKEAPIASEIKLGQTLADSTLTGGLVTKGETSVSGKFVWKDSSIAPTKAGTAEYTAVFTPDDPTTCDLIETQVSVTTGKGAPEITAWPTANGQYKVGGYVNRCVTLEGGKANIPGEFRITEESKYTKIPDSITESMDIELVFIPKDTTNYENVYKTVTVSFGPADPDCKADCFISSDGKNFEIRGRIANDENWSIHTGNFYLYLDGEKIELTEPDQKIKYDISTLSAGEHTIYSEYIPGENDVYAHDTSDTVTFTVKAFYAVNVTDSTGTKTLDSYLPGKTVTVTAQPHEKSYYDFTGWTAEGITLTEEEAAQQKISFTMPENEVNLTANYKFNFKNFVKYIFEQIGIKLGALITQGIEWIKGLLP